jgi:hypothetical protein
MASSSCGFFYKPSVTRTDVLSGLLIVTPCHGSCNGVPSSLHGPVGTGGCCRLQYAHPVVLRPGSLRCRQLARDQPCSADVAPRGKGHRYGFRHRHGRRRRRSRPRALPRRRCPRGVRRVRPVRTGACAAAVRRARPCRRLARRLHAPVLRRAAARLRRGGPPVPLRRRRATCHWEWGTVARFGLGGGWDDEAPHEDGVPVPPALRRRDCRGGGRRRCAEVAPDGAVCQGPLRRGLQDVSGLEAAIGELLA